MGNRIKRDNGHSLRVRAEERLKEGIPGQKHADDQKLLHELQVHKVELELQNEELLGTKAELELSIKRYDDFYDFAPIPYFSFNRQGTILEVNLTATSKLNVARSYLLGKKFKKFLTAESSRIFEATILKVFETKEKASCQVTIHSDGLAPLYALIQFSSPVSDNKCLAVASDITELLRIEEQKHISDEKFRIISTNIPDHILLQDNDLRYTWVHNPQLGLTVEEMIGKTDFELTNFDDAVKLTNLKREVLQTGISQYVNLSLIDKTGNRNYFEGSLIPLRNSRDNIEGLIGFFKNVTERINVENELSRTRNYLEQLINYANAPIIVWNPSSEIVLFNKAFERLTGYEGIEVLGEKLDFLFPGKSMDKSKDMIRQTQNGNFWESIEIPILCKNGDTKIVLWNSANIYEKDNKTLISTIAQGNDITSRKKVENDLTESQRKLGLALENGNIGVWEYDIEKDILTLDERMKKIFGVGARPFDGSFKSFEKFVMEEDLRQMRDAFNRTIEKGRTFETVIRTNTRSRSKTFITLKGRRYSDENEPTRLIGVGFDITEMQKGSERALFKLNTELARSNKELEQFAYVASHDLQEPLRMVSSFTQMLAQRYGDKLDENANEYIHYAVDGSKRMYDLINGLLAYSRVNTKGKEFEAIDLTDVLGEVQRNLRLSIEKSGAVIMVDDMPVINADGNQMMQLFQNLIANGIKFSNSTPKIKITSKEYTHHYLFSVKDEGVGIEPQYFERIFQIFQRLLPRDEYEGTGIGLAICKRIVERHGGHIWVESEPGKGSTFWFTIRKNLSE
jgi:PAS domain S-box-containing protein